MQLFNILKSTGGAKYSELYLEFKHKSHVTFLKRVERVFFLLRRMPQFISFSYPKEMDSILNRCLENALFRLIFCISALFIRYLCSNFADNSDELYEI